MRPKKTSEDHTKEYQDAQSRRRLTKLSTQTSGLRQIKDAEAAGKAVKENSPNYNKNGLNAAGEPTTSEGKSKRRKERSASYFSK